MRRALPLLAAALISVVAAGCSRNQPEAVFLIVVDTLRPDRLSAYGRDLYATPYTDTLASEGVLFENAFTVSSWGLPAMGAMMTSRYPTELGLVASAGSDTLAGPRRRHEPARYTLAPDEVTLAEVLRAEGFTTAAFVNQPLLNIADGFAQGIDYYAYPSDIHTIARLGDAPPAVHDQWPPFAERAREVDELIVEEFQKWLSEHDDERVFVWLHLYSPHHPYLPPPWTKRRVASSKERFAVPTATDEYDGEVIACDEIVGRALDAIDRIIGNERSLVVLTSDHGEAFGEHGTIGHGNSLHSEITRIPLIVRAPAVPAGRRVKTAVRAIDIFPTILEMTGAQSRLPGGVRGESVVPLLTGGGPWRDVYAEGLLYGPRHRSLASAGMKLIYTEPDGAVALYNRYLDPGETVDVRAGHPATADSLVDALTALHESLRGSVREWDPPREGAQRLQEVLEAMGYGEVDPEYVPPVPDGVPPPPGHRH